jgi:hypothetical protein
VREVRAEDWDDEEGDKEELGILLWALEVVGEGEEEGKGEWNEWRGRLECVEYRQLQFQSFCLSI